MFTVLTCKLCLVKQNTAHAHNNGARARAYYVIIQNGVPPRTVGVLSAVLNSFMVVVCRLVVMSGV